MLSFLVFSCVDKKKEGDKVTEPVITETVKNDTVPSTSTEEVIVETKAETETKEVSEEQ